MTVAVSPEVQAEEAQASGGPLRLNLGGAGEGFRESRIPGFKTVDLREGEGTDIVSDVSDLSMIDEKSVSEIYASNVLEHFSHKRTVYVLEEWRRVLVPGGKLWLSVPDFDATVRLYLKMGLTPWVQYLAWGDQEHSLNYHYINFTWSSLSFVLHQAGFKDFKMLPELPYGIKDASVLRDNAENKPISLNCEATA